MRHRLALQVLRLLSIYEGARHSVAHAQATSRGAALMGGIGLHGHVLSAIAYGWCCRPPMRNMVYTYLDTRSE